MIDPPNRPVAIPAFPEVEGLQFVEIGKGFPVIERHAHAFQSEIDEHTEEFPVVVDEFQLARADEIGGDRLLLAIVKRFPDVLGHERQGEADGGELDQPLIAVGQIAPIFGMSGIGAVCQPAAIEIPMRKRAAAGNERNDPLAASSGKPGVAAILALTSSVLSAGKVPVDAMTAAPSGPVTNLMKSSAASL